jgi:hypothetical protein
MVGAKVRDGGGQPSSIQLSLEKEALEIAKSTIFRPVKRIEVVQGMVRFATLFTNIASLDVHFVATYRSLELFYRWHRLDYSR